MSRESGWGGGGGVKVRLRGCQVVLFSQAADQQKGYQLPETRIMPSQVDVPLISSLRLQNRGVF